MADQEYEVGYRRPPKQTQFKKGQSGNPKGRPKGARGLDTMLMEELKAKIIVSENGRSKKLKKAEVLVKQVMNKALSGDHRAIAQVISISQRHEEKLAAKAKPILETLPEEDQQVMQSLLARMKTQIDDSTENT